MRNPRNAPPAKAPAAQTRPSWSPKWGLAAALAGAYLAFSPRLTAVYSLPKLLAISAGIAAAWLAVAASAFRGAPPRPRGALDAPLTAFLTLCVLATALSSDPFLSLVGHHRLYSCGLAAMFLAASAFLATEWSDEPERPDFMFRIVLASSALVGLYAVLQSVGLEPFYGVTKELLQGRAIASQGSAVYLGATLLPAVPIALHGIVSGGNARNWGIACGIATAAGLACTLSRGAWVGTVAGAGLYLALSRGKRPALDRRSTALAAAALAAILLALAGAHWARTVGNSDSARLELWRSTAGIIREAPLFGTGLDTFEMSLRRHRTEAFVRLMTTRGGQMNAHNDFLQIAATMGLAGLLAYLWLLAALAREIGRGLRDPSRRGPTAAIAGALFGLFVQAKFNPMPLSSLIIAAVLAGLLPGSREQRAPCPRLLTASGLGLALACGWGAWRLVRADYLHKRAEVFWAVGRHDEALEDLRRVSALNPLETLYAATRFRLLEAAALSDPEPLRRLELLREAAGLGEDLVRRRPAHVDAHQLLGNALMGLNLGGGGDRLAEAGRELAQASRLDPYFRPLIENRLKLARLTRDPAAEAELSVQLRRLDSLAPR
ncbi:MAG TPA: hypothetical protein DD417_18990 [Elusimicrobia bacterium]|nr:hypothetical protein [Elusimicrobiota bacterium]